MIKHVWTSSVCWLRKINMSFEWGCAHILFKMRYLLCSACFVFVYWSRITDVLSVIIRGFERDLFGSFGKGLYNNQIFSCLHMIQTVLLLCFIYIYYVCMHISTCLLAVACSELHTPHTHNDVCDVSCVYDMLCVWLCVNACWFLRE